MVPMLVLQTLEDNIALSSPVAIRTKIFWSCQRMLVSWASGSHPFREEVSWASGSRSFRQEIMNANNKQRWTAAADECRI
jgi:hypothetical protein